MLFSKIYSAEETERHKSWNLSSKNKIRIVTGDGIKKKGKKEKRKKERARDKQRDGLSKIIVAKYNRDWLN